MPRTFHLVPFLFAAACAPAAAPSPPPATPAPVITAAPSAPQPSQVPRMRLGHYSTTNGLFGLVLDRTAARPLARIDGKPEVLDLAVRDRGDEVITLVSARDEIVLDISAAGRITVTTGTQQSVPLRRDGDGERLAEPPAPTVDAALMTALDARLEQKCSAPIHVEVAGKPPATATRGVFNTLERSARAVEQVCRDAPGQTAVKAKVRRVRVSHDATTRLGLDGGVLTVQGDLEAPAQGPFSDEIRKFLESKL